MSKLTDKEKIDVLLTKIKRLEQERDTLQHAVGNFQEESEKLIAEVRDTRTQMQQARIELEEQKELYMDALKKNTKHKVKKTGKMVNKIMKKFRKRDKFMQ